MNNTAKLLLIPALLACAGLAQAQTAGSILVRAGATTITPNVSSGDLTPPSLVGTKSSIGSSTRLSGGITYMVDDNIALDLPVAIPFEHDISGDGAILGVGKIGTVKAPAGDPGCAVALFRAHCHVPPLCRCWPDLCSVFWRTVHVHTDGDFRRHSVQPHHLVGGIQMGGDRATGRHSPTWRRLVPGCQLHLHTLEHPHDLVDRANAGCQAGPQLLQPGRRHEVLSSALSAFNTRQPSGCFFLACAFHDGPGNTGSPGYAQRQCTRNTSDSSRIRFPSHLTRATSS
jgi:hypothetical protein